MWRGVYEQEGIVGSSSGDRKTLNQLRHVIKPQSQTLEFLSALQLVCVELCSRSYISHKNTEGRGFSCKFVFVLSRSDLLTLMTVVQRKINGHCSATSEYNAH